MGPAPAEVSEAALRRQVQTVVAHADVHSITFAQLRAEIERRLGLVAGALGARKRQRKEVVMVVQQEVAKKMRRTPDCDRLVRALVEFEAYPDETRQMLIESLPYAMARQSGAELHPHQVQLLGIAHDAVRAAYQNAARHLEESESAVGEAEASLTSSNEGLAAATLERTQTRAAADSVAARLQGAEREVEQAEEELSRAEAARDAASAGVVELRNARNTVADAVAGPFALLRDGTWQDSQARNAAVEELQRRLADIGAEDTLISAVPIAMARPPSERGGFDRVTVESLARVLENHIASLDARLAAGEEAAAEAALLAAGALLSAARDHAKSLRGALQDAEATVEAALARHASAEAEVAERRAALDARRAERELLADKAQDLSGALAVAERLASSGGHAGGGEGAAGGEAGAQANAADAPAQDPAEEPACPGDGVGSGGGLCGGDPSGEAGVGGMSGCEAAVPDDLAAIPALRSFALELPVKEETASPKTPAKVLDNVASPRSQSWVSPRRVPTPMRAPPPPRPSGEA